MNFQTSYNDTNKAFKDFCETKFTVTENDVDIYDNPIVIATYTDADNNEVNCYKTIKKETSMAECNFEYLIALDKANPGVFYSKLLEIFDCILQARLLYNNGDKDCFAEQLNDLKKIVTEWLNCTGISITDENIDNFIKISMIFIKLKFNKEQVSSIMNLFFENMLCTSYSLCLAPQSKDNYNGNKSYFNDMILLKDIESCTLPRHSVCFYFISEENNSIDLCAYNNCSRKNNFFKVKNINLSNIHEKISDICTSIIKSGLIRDIKSVCLICSADGFLELVFYKYRRECITVKYKENTIGIIELLTGNWSKNVEQVLQNYPEISTYINELCQIILEFQVLLPELSKQCEQQPSVSINENDVYVLYNTPCGNSKHLFWSVLKTYDSKAVFQCNICGSKTVVSYKKILKRGKLIQRNNKNVSSVPVQSENISPAAVSPENKQPTPVSPENKSTDPVQPQNKSVKQVSEADVIVLSSSKHCTNKNHKIEDVIGILPVKTDERIENRAVDLGYCSDCNKYIMLTSTYLAIKGKPVCWVRDLRTDRVYNDPNADIFINSPEHIIHKYGYNVQSGNGLSSLDRQQILVNLINNKVLSKNEIISHLEYCIKMASGKDNMSAAISKWKQDLEFLCRFKVDKNAVSVNSITLKYKK